VVIAGDEQFCRRRQVIGQTDFEIQLRIGSGTREANSRPKACDQKAKNEKKRAVRTDLRPKA